MSPYEEWEQLSQTEQHIISDILELLKAHGVAPLESAQRLKAAEYICDALTWGDGKIRPRLKSRPRMPFTEETLDMLAIESGWILHKYGSKRAHESVSVLWLRLEKIIQVMGYYVPEKWRPFRKKSLEKHDRWLELVAAVGDTDMLTCAP